MFTSREHDGKKKCEPCLHFLLLCLVIFGMTGKQQMVQLRSGLALRHKILIPLKGDGKGYPLIHTHTPFRLYMDTSPPTQPYTHMKYRYCLSSRSSNLRHWTVRQVVSDNGKETLSDRVFFKGPKRECLAEINRLNTELQARGAYAPMPI
jgi:hypothetical protein